MRIVAHDEAHKPPPRHTRDTYVVLCTTERVLAGTEIRWDYDMGEQRERTYRAQLQAEGVSDEDLDGPAYKRERWAPPAELTRQQEAEAQARRAGHAMDVQRAGAAGGGERAVGRKRRNLQSRWEGHSKITEIVTGPETEVVSRKRPTRPVTQLRGPDPVTGTWLRCSV